MHILMTADTVGGVWTYTRELASGLVRRGHQVTLISFGRLPSEDQVRWMEGLTSIQYHATEYRLEWMQESEQDIEASRAALGKLIAEVKPDLLHLNQYAYGSLPTDVPRVVVAHSDVVSWWVSVRGEDPPDDEWMNWYRRTVLEGVNGATAVVAPSETMLQAIRQNYLEPQLARIIYNGRDPAIFNPYAPKQNIVVSAGRLWDQAKQVSLLLKNEHAVPIWMIGSRESPEELPGGAADTMCEDSNVRLLGFQSEDELSRLLASASIYAATSRYEPFGLAPVEAAFSGCALIMNDISSFRELWGDSAYYFRRNDPMSLAAAVRELSTDHNLRAEYVERAYQHAIKQFQAERMVNQYERLYRTLVMREAAA